MERGAVISECGTFRYSLIRKWADGPQLVLCMLNPSTADAQQDDATIRRCIGFGQSLGFSGIEVVNLFAFRTTFPVELKRAGWPVGPDNDAWIRAAAERSIETGGAFCCAWGASVGGLGRPWEVLEILAHASVDAQCLEQTRDGHPSHPLYLPATTRLRSLP